LHPLAGAAFRSSLPKELADRVTVREDSTELLVATEASSGGLWRQLGLLMLAAMLLETILAWRFGRR
jgi:hypothetical protein